MVSYLVGITLVKMKLSQYSGLSTWIKIEQNLKQDSKLVITAGCFFNLHLIRGLILFIFYDCSQKSLELKSMLLVSLQLSFSLMVPLNKLLCFLGP